MLQKRREELKKTLRAKLYYKEYEMMVKERDGLTKKNAFLQNKIAKEKG